MADGRQHPLRATANLKELETSETFLTRAVARKNSGDGATKPPVMGPAKVAIQVFATGSSGGGCPYDRASEAGSIDCAVHVQLQQAAQEVKQQPVQAARARKWWLKRVIAILSITGCILTAILLPYSLVIGFSFNLPREFKLLPAPSPAYSLLFAFSNSISHPTASSVLPAELAAQVSQWTVLTSSGVHVAALNSRQAMQQAIKVLANTTGLKYALADFKLVSDRHVSSITSPDELLDLSRLPARQLLQQRPLQETQQHKQLQQETNRSGMKAALHNTHSCRTSNCRYAQASKLVAARWRRLALRQQKRRRLQLSTHATMSIPATTHHLAHLSVQEAEQTRSDEVVHVQSWVKHTNVAAISSHHSNDCAECMSSAGCKQQPLQSKCLTAVQADLDATATTSGGNKCTACGTPTAGNSQSPLPRYQRNLHHYPPLALSAELQPQQRQARAHSQKGGKGVAWYLTEAGLDVKKAWNTTYGLDEVTVAVIDTGIELSQGGVGPSVWVNAGEVVGDGIDNDGNGFVDDVMGWDFGGSCADAACTSCMPGPDPTDTAGWGTHAASVIAAQPETAAGAAGLAPGVRVMALKVSDCRARSLLNDAAAQQLSSGSQFVSAADDVGPVLLGSAAVQALDYAVLNGAHIVLAAWQAGGIIHAGGANNSTSNGTSASSATAGESTTELTCVLGQAASTDATHASSTTTDGCIAAVQKLLFEDALRPLEQAGVLIVTMQSDLDSNSTSAATGVNQDFIAPAPILPCALGLEMSNVLCAAASDLVPAGKEALSAEVTAAEFFADLAYEYSLNRSSNSSNATTVSNGQDSSSSQAPGTQQASNDQYNPSNPDQESNTITNVTGSVRRALLAKQQSVQLTVPGSNILSGWAWGSHSVVSGNGAAAAVAAGAAALTWSNLGRSLGAEASGAAAFEGLGQLVREILIKSCEPTNSRRTSVVSAAPGDTVTSQASLVGAAELNLAKATKAASLFAGPLLLKPAHISPTITAISNTLSYSWYITSRESGPFDTLAMSFVARKALNPASAFPLESWEFYGTTALVKIDGFVVVQRPGNYSLAVVSTDGFLVWIQDKWLRMRRVGTAGAAMSLNPNGWTANVVFNAAGYYKLRVIINVPQSSFDLLWRTPGAPAFTHIPHFATFGRTQPHPVQLAEQLTVRMRTWGSSTSSSQVGRTSSSKVANSSSIALSRGSRSVGAAVIGGPSSSSSNNSAENSSRGPVIDYAGSRSGHMPSSNSSSAHPEVSSKLRQSGGSTSGDSAHHAAIASDSNSEHKDNMKQPGSTDYAPSHDTSWSDAFGGDISSASGASHRSSRVREKGLTAKTSVEVLPNQRQVNNSIGLTAAGSNSSSGDVAGTAAVDMRRNTWHASSQPDMHQPQLLPPPTTLRSLLNNMWKDRASNKQQTVASLPGVFSFGLTLEEPWIYRTIIPSLSNLRLTHTGILKSPGLEITQKPSLQKQLLGYEDPLDVKAAYGVIQGWVDWKLLNPAASDWLQDFVVTNGSPSTPASVSNGDTNNHTSDSGTWLVMDSVQASRAGAQFQMVCGSKETSQGCTLHVDGLAVAGSTGETSRSTCIVPARRRLGGNSGRGSRSTTVVAAQSGGLMHVELLFTTDDIRTTTVSVKSRPCLLAEDGSVELPSGSNGSFAVMTAASGASALGVSSAEIKRLGDADVSGGYIRGMMCTMSATVPAHDFGSRNPQHLEKTVHLTVQQIQQAMVNNYNLTEAEESAAATAAAAAASTNVTGNINSPYNARMTQLPPNSTADAHDVMDSSNSTDNNNSRISNSTGYDDYDYWIPEADPHAEATSKAVSGIKGIAVADLAPDWVATLPHDTSYSFSCGCYWNGSWQGGVTVGVHAGGSGTAGMSLAGWPVEVDRVLPQYGPSDIFVTEYSPYQARLQLASDSTSADLIHWQGNGPDSGSGVAGLGILSDPVAAAHVGFRPGFLAGGKVFTLGVVDGMNRLNIPAGSGWHQLLVIEGEHLSASSSVVVVADVPGLSEITSDNSTRPYAPTKQGWMPGEWDAWLPW